MNLTLENMKWYVALLAPAKRLSGEQRDIILELAPRSQIG